MKSGGHNKIWFLAICNFRMATQSLLSAYFILSESYMIQTSRAVGGRVSEFWSSDFVILYHPVDWENLKT